MYLIFKKKENIPRFFFAYFLFLFFCFLTVTKFCGVFFHDNNLMIEKKIHEEEISCYSFASLVQYC